METWPLINHLRITNCYIPSGTLWKSSSLQSDSSIVAESNHASSTLPVTIMIKPNQEVAVLALASERIKKIKKKKKHNYHCILFQDTEQETASDPNIK